MKSTLAQNAGMNSKERMKRMTTRKVIDTGIDLSALARDMLLWEQKRRELDDLEQAVKDAVLRLGKSQTVGNVKATYTSGRKTYDYEGTAVQAGLAENVELVGMFSHLVTDWRALCKAANVDEILIKSQSSPGVSLRLTK